MECDSRVLASLHDFKVERVVLFGNVQVTTQAMALLMDRGIDTAFVSLAGRLKGRIALYEQAQYLLRSVMDRSAYRPFQGWRG